MADTYLICLNSDTFRIVRNLNLELLREEVDVNHCQGRVVLKGSPIGEWLFR